MKYCSKCLTTNLRPNADFLDGVCIACRYSNSNSQSNPSLKLEMLRDRIKKSRAGQRIRGPYDCIVGVSGGKDSTRQAHWVRDRLGLRPLLVCCAYPPKQMSEIGAENLSNLIEMGFDLITATPAPQAAAQLALTSFEKFGNVCKASEMSLFATVPRLAIDLGVTTIFWGENPALQVGDSAVEGVDEFDGNSLRNLNTLVDGGNKWIEESVSSHYLAEHYFYPDQFLFEKKKLNIYYLGAAWDDWSVEQNSCYGALQGLTLRPNEENETGDISNASMLDEEFTNINMMLKYYKFGFGRTTDSVNEKIRNGELSRAEGIEIVDSYDGICSDRIIDSYCEYVGINSYTFWEIANKWVNQTLFEIRIGNRPKRLFNVGIDYGN